MRGTNCPGAQAIYKAWSPPLQAPGPSKSPGQWAVFRVVPAAVKAEAESLLDRAGIRETCIPFPALTLIPHSALSKPANGSHKIRTILNYVKHVETDDVRSEQSILFRETTIVSHGQFTVKTNIQQALKHTF